MVLGCAADQVLPAAHVADADDHADQHIAGPQWGDVAAKHLSADGRAPGASHTVDLPPSGTLCARTLPLQTEGSALDGLTSVHPFRSEQPLNLDAMSVRSSLGDLERLQKPTPKAKPPGKRATRRHA